MTELAESAMEAEFDTIAVWTERIVRELGPEYAIPAACRGSASPAWLRWVADGLALSPGDAFLDAGAGLGGPAAWVRDHYRLRPVLAEPMTGACLGARRLFGLPALAAWSQQLPFRDATFDAVWLLGVYCTVEDQPGLLKELRRVLNDTGRLGMLVLVQVAENLTAPPTGNHFPTGQGLRSRLIEAGFVIDAETTTTELAGADEDWARQIETVERQLGERYGSHPTYRVAHEQEERIGRLLRCGDLETRLLTAHVR